MSQDSQHQGRHQSNNAGLPQKGRQAGASSVNNTIFINNASSDTCSPRGVPYSAAHAAVTMAVTCPVQLGFEMSPVYAAEAIKRTDFIEVPKALKNIRILGLMAVISYMTVILSVWMYANFGGYVYFMAGEPNLFIKYAEWALGLMGILVTTDSLRKEIKEIA